LVNPPYIIYHQTENFLIKPSNEDNTPLREQTGNIFFFLCYMPGCLRHYPFFAPNRGRSR